MAKIRLKALELVNSRKPRRPDFPKDRVTAYFGQYVFDKKKMKEFLSPEIYRALVETIESGQRLDSGLHHFARFSAAPGTAEPSEHN